MVWADRILSRLSDRILTDGRQTLTYAELPGALEKRNALWRDVRRRPTVLVGRNDLGTAVAALHLLATGRSFYFWRPPETWSGEALPWDDLPGFCTTAVTTSQSTGGDELAIRPATEAAAQHTDTSYIYLGTSGTTARPKLAAYTPERLLGNAKNCVRRFEITANDRVLLPLPVAHMYGFAAAFLPAVLAGASVCLLPRVNLLTYLQAERQFDPTVVFLTPGLAQQFVSARKEPRPYRLTALGADRIDAESFARYEDRHGCTVCVYGSTELGAVAAGSPRDAFERRSQSSGNLLDGVRLVAYPEAASFPGAMIPLCFDHPYGMSGYANTDGLPELPRDVFRDGVYLTRDLGELDAHGDLHIRGRRDDTVKRDGLFVAPGDVERALESLPGVARAIVLTGEPTSRGVALMAFCVRRGNEAGEEAEIRRRCLDVLPAHAVPDRIVFLEHIPLLPTGKPDRAALHSLITSLP